MRRGTTSEWNAADPTLNEGEFGYNSTLYQIKIGDGETVWSELEYLVSAGSLDASLGAYIEDSQKSAINGVAELDGSKNILAPAAIIFEGTVDGNETTLEVADPSADRTITFPNVSGTVITTGNLSDITNIGVFTSTIVMEGSTEDSNELTISAGDPTADRTVTFPDATGTVALTTDIPSLTGYVTESGSQTLTNKTLTSPVVSGLYLSDLSIVLEGTADDYETTLTATDPTADRTITFPDSTGTVALTSNLDSYATLSGAIFTGAVTGTSLTLSGDLTVNGTTTNINSTNLVVEDKNIVLGDTATPTDTTADGGGLTLKGDTDKTFAWIDATDAWTSSEHMNLFTGKSYKINNIDISAALPALTWGEVKDGTSGLVIS
jgi:hypothetical protein